MILGYDFFENTYCQGSLVGGYSYLNQTEAKDACNKHEDCGSITRNPKWRTVEGDQWYGICKGTDLIKSTEGMDSWVKLNHGEFLLLSVIC